MTVFTSETTGAPYTVESARMVVFFTYMVTALPSISTGVLTLKTWVFTLALESWATAVLPVVDRMPSGL